MSSILDALEKAEEERVRDLSQGVQPARRVNRRGRPRLAWIAAGVVLLLLINLLVWWFSLRDLPEAVSPLAGQHAAAPESRIDPVAQAVSQPAQPNPLSKPALSLNEQLKRNAVPSAKPLIEEAQVARKPAPVPIAAPPSSAAASAPPETESVASRVVRAEPLPEQPKRRPPAPLSTPPAESIAIPEVPPPPIPGFESEPVAERPQQEQIPLVWELPQTLREKVLRLKSSVHVYSEIPAQRFVIINMKRYEEGDTLTPDDFRLERIDRDGVVIDYGAGLVRVPRR